MAILAVVPKGANVLDLGAGRAARAEARAEAGFPKAYLKLSAGYVEIVPEVALTVAFAFEASHIKDALAGLLVDPEDVEELLKDGLTAPDITVLSEFVSGLSLGES